MVEAYLSVLELGYFELGEAFKELADENVWRRPAAGLLSVGELAAHIAYGEAIHLAGKPGNPPGTNVSNCPVKSVLVDERFSYYPGTLGQSPSEEHLVMTGEQVHRELLRVHEESVAYFKALNPDLESVAPGYPANFTYGEFLKYVSFHLAYHTGQIYSVRHLLGEETVDN